MKTAAQLRGGFQMNTILLNRVLERLSWAELRSAGCGDSDGLASARVAAGASRTCLCTEDTEASNRDLVAGLEAGNDSVDDSLDRAVSISLGAAEHVVHLRYDVSFVHRIR